MAKKSNTKVATVAAVTIIAAGTEVKFLGYAEGADPGALKPGKTYFVGEYNKDDESYTLTTKAGKAVDAALRSEFSVPGEDIGGETVSESGGITTVVEADDPKPAKDTKPSKATKQTKAEEEEPAEDAKPVKVLASVKEAIKASDGDAVKAACALHERVEQSYFVLGGILAVIQEKDAHHAMLDSENMPKYQTGQPGFAKFCEQEMGMKYRKAQYLVQVYNVLSRLGVPEAKFSGIGWSKLKESIPYLLAGGDADFAMAQARALPISEFKASIRKKMVEEGMSLHGNATGAGTANHMTEFTFHAHQDQAEIIRQALSLAARALELADPNEDPSTISQCLNHIVSTWYQAETASV